MHFSLAGSPTKMLDCLLSNMCLYAFGARDQTYLPVIYVTNFYMYVVNTKVCEQVTGNCQLSFTGINKNICKLGIFKKVYMLAMNLTKVYIMCIILTRNCNQKAFLHVTVIRKPFS